MSEPEETGTLAAALVAALADLTVVEKGRTAVIETKSGANYTYGYADLADVVKLSRPVLAKQGLVALTPVHAHGDGLACTVTFLHVSGERLDCDPLPFPPGRDSQATGSAITYFRRYALTAALGIAAGDDDDGAAATARPQQQEDPVPGLRSSIKGAIDKLSEDEKVDLKAWFAENDLGAVERLNAQQCELVLARLMPHDDDPGRPFDDG